MMCVENPESFSQTMCVAPAEGEKPLNIMILTLRLCQTQTNFHVVLAHLAVIGQES